MCQKLIQKLNIDLFHFRNPKTSKNSTVWTKHQLHLRFWHFCGRLTGKPASSLKNFEQRVTTTTLLNKRSSAQGNCKCEVPTWGVCFGGHNSFSFVWSMMWENQKPRNYKLYLVTMEFCIWLLWKLSWIYFWNSIANCFQIPFCMNHRSNLQLEKNLRFGLLLVVAGKFSAMEFCK